MADQDTRNLENPSIQLSKAIFTIQSRLLDLPHCSEQQLLAAGSLLSRSDYEDVVTERSLALLCGFPRCPNSNNTDTHPLGNGRQRYRISLREHRVYDVQEATRFCSVTCCVSSNAFSATLHSRTVGPTPSHISHILSLFLDEHRGHDNQTTDLVVDSGLSSSHKEKNDMKQVDVVKGDFGHSKLLTSIHENSEDSGEISVEQQEWLPGPSNAIEGYVPQSEKKHSVENDSEEEDEEEEEEVEEEGEEDDDKDVAFESSYLKWPGKSSLRDTDNVFRIGDLLNDAPPEGFKLTLSTFASIWEALFGWLTCSSMAYTYGSSEGSENDFLLLNGREYPYKVSLSDGRSTEIKITLAGCISRALPQVVSELRLPIPISTIEKAIGSLLETMSFMEAIPPFKTKEWNVIVLLFLEALSVSRIPTLSSHMTTKTVQLKKVIEAAQLRRDEYELMKDLMIPLGRVPQFSVRSGA